MRILVVDDDLNICELLKLYLENDGYVVYTANDGKQAVDMFKNKTPDLVLLDIMLPELNGLEVLRRIRRTSEIPVIMLTARDAVMDKVSGLDMGADDYITKPFAIEELLARIRVCLKRKHIETAPEENSYILKAGRLSLDKSSHQVSYDGKPIELTNREFILLEVLLENRSIVLSRDTLLERVWGFDYMGETNVVDVYIHYLRNKIDDTVGEKIIETVRGVGYMIK